LFNYLTPNYIADQASRQIVEKVLKTVQITNIRILTQLFKE